MMIPLAWSMPGLYRYTFIPARRHWVTKEKPAYWSMRESLLPGIMMRTSIFERAAASRACCNASVGRK